MRLLTSLIFAIVMLVLPVVLQATDINVTKYGAVGDEKTLNTLFIQHAIDDCNKNGGGKVIFPPGKYLSGTIVLKNNVTLFFEKNAVLLGSTNVDDYQNMDPFTDGLGVDVGWALVVAVDADNIGIEGNGVIDGQGSKLKAEQILKDTRPEGQRWGRRPFLLRIVRCNGVTVKNITLNYSAAWTSHYFQSRKVRIENVKIVSRGVAHNDGIDIDGCQDVRIKDCDVVSGDDALCFKTTSSKMACSDIVVSGMRLKSSQAAIKMGTESMAPFENIKISDCYIYETNNGGIKLLTVDGAHLRNIDISGITMMNVKTPMLFRLGSRLSVFRKGSDVQQQTGTFENVVVRDVKARSADSTQLKPASGILITGVPGHYITGLTLQNIEIDLPGGGAAEHARQAVPEAIDKYPEVKTFGPFVPAYGIWARHVKDLKLINLKFNLTNNDLRPAFVCEDGKDIELKEWKIPVTTGAESVIRLENVAGARISGVTVKGNASLFVSAEGAECKDIKIAKNQIPGIKNEILFSDKIKTGSTGEFRPLFNNKDLQGWYSFLKTNGKNSDPDTVFSVSDGMLHITGKEFGYIVTEKNYSDFHLAAEFKWGERKYPPRENKPRDNGILYYAVAEDRVWPRAIECQVQEGDCGDFWLIDSVTVVIDGARTQPTKNTRLIKKLDNEKPTGEWNRVEVIAKDGKVTHIVNGVVVNEGEQASLRSGRIIIQSEGAEIWYRKIEIKEL